MIRLIMLLVMTLCLADCEAPPNELAYSGAAPMVPVRIGPVPGPGAPAPLEAGPYTDNAVARAEGKRLFAWYNCAGCHGDHGGGGMGPSLRDEDWMYGNADPQVFDSISQGRQHGMPAWGTKLPEEQIWKLVSYIQSMRKPSEPEAPTDVPEKTVVDPDTLIGVDSRR